MELQEYLDHIALYPKQKDVSIVHLLWLFTNDKIQISSCAGFKTLAHAESKNATGLRSTGIGMVICARHEFILPNGAGDLQRGERYESLSITCYACFSYVLSRYCNMDYMALSSLAIVARALREIFVSYDIVCQWSLHFLERMRRMPDCLHLPDHLAMAWGIPKCHCKGHKIDCQVKFSMNIQRGVGRTDGEGIERAWSVLNNAAPATKEMLPGHRHDILDRQMGSHNWAKTIGLGLFFTSTFLSLCSYVIQGNSLIGDTIWRSRE